MAPIALPACLPCLSTGFTSTSSLDLHFFFNQPPATDGPSPADGTPEIHCLCATLDGTLFFFFFVYFWVEKTEQKRKLEAGSWLDRQGRPCYGPHWCWYSYHHASWLCASLHGRAGQVAGHTSARGRLMQGSYIRLMTLVYARDLNSKITNVFCAVQFRWLLPVSYVE